MSESIRPNLFIIGAMKSGSTSLHEYLATHPDIFMSREKEPGYFVDAMWGSRDRATYLPMFAEGAGRKYRGESSTHYAKLPTYPGVAERIREFSPEARIIYIMREPVARTISHYWHEVKAVFDVAETRPILEALRAHVPYTAYSDYAMQLAPYFRVFPLEQIHVLTLESLLSGPAIELEKIWNWLGVPRGTVPPLEAHNRVPEVVKQAAGSGLLNRLAYSNTLSPVIRAIPEPLKAIARKAAYREVRPKLDTDTVLEVRKLLTKDFGYQEKLRTLQNLLGRDFPEWEEGRK